MNSPIASIVVKDLDLKNVDLIQQHSGKVQLLLIYNNDCLGCTGRAIPLAYEFQLQYPDIKVAAIHSDFTNREGTKQNIKSIFTSGEIPFPIYIDQHHQVYDQFKAEGTPQWLLITATGELYRSIFGSQDNAKNRLFYALESLVNA
ncbi:TlpA family protein disulfide reductase [Nonlabens ulvanivorans]|uniref:TlpA family protein disulfide reductase n=1 Tax=Nonlabens ulvanivorans TaxID=906888 RepID=UPI002942B29C|nr:redoxin domain-containing protein [Nonlabens ulvanivorans]WOI23754.1 redoxin domain-containing protein [Nonlabens ulvanivorans]